MKKNTDFDRNNKLKKNVRRIHVDVRRDKHIRAKIDHHVRVVYDQIVKEGTPDRFSKLFKQLERPKDKEEST